MADIPKVNEENFQEEVMFADQPVLVDFSAVWCAPCKLLDPIVEQLASEWSDRLKVVKLDADDNPDLVFRYQVMGLPTLLLFIGGKPRERLIGYQPKERIQSKLNPHLQAV